MVDSGEQCDDQNTKDRDGCSSRCLLEYVSSAQYCGDGIIQGSEGEQCDNGITQNGVPGTSCTRDCKIVAKNIPNVQVCGNGITEGDEQCDAGKSINGDYPGSSCLTNCRIPYCGDGILAFNEQCDYNDVTDSRRIACTRTCELSLGAAPGGSPLAGNITGTPTGVDPQGNIKNIPTPARTPTGPGLVIFLVSGAAAGIGVVRRRYLK